MLNRKIIEGVDQKALEYVVDNLQPEHSDELEATRFDEVSRLEYAQYILSHQGAAYTALDRDGNPAVVGGIGVVSPGVAQTWMIATARINEVGVAVNRQTRQLIAATFSSGVAHRIQSVIMVTDQRAARWLERLGFHLERTLHQFGKHREDFLMYVLFDQDWSDGKEPDSLGVRRKGEQPCPEVSGRRGFSDSPDRHCKDEGEKETIIQ